MAGGLTTPAAAHHANPPETYPETCEGPGFNDTPVLPARGWRFGDACRPIPSKVDPGQPTFSDPPADATVLLGDGSNGDLTLSEWTNRNGKPSQWTVTDNYVAVNPDAGWLQSKDEISDAHYHVEWRIPENVSGSGQGSGNSGFWLASNYEIQILNSYENPTYADGMAGALYGEHPPLVNAARPPGKWQKFDIIWHAPRFTDSGDAESRGIVTVYWNDILVQSETVVHGSTPYKAVPEYHPHPVEMPIQLQNHGDPIQYRGIWYQSLPTPTSVLDFQEDDLTAETPSSTVEATLTNKYSAEMTNGEVTLTPSGSSNVTVTSQGGTSFQTLAAGNSQSMAWEVTRPTEDSGPHLLNSTTSYAVNDSQQGVTYQVPVYPQPNPKIPAEPVNLTQTQVATADDNPMKVDVAPDGRVFLTERGAPFDRYPEHPTGNGTIRIYNPDTGETTTAFEKDVHTGIEEGAQGIVFDPDFEENGWIYFFYDRSNEAIADNQQELESLNNYKQPPSEAAEGPQPYDVVSRFTVEGDTIDPESEVEIIRITAQRERCCHIGGALRFDNDGNLLITTGDGTDPFQSSGYAPIDEREGRKFFDAQRSAANTNDLRGSLLRVTPQDEGGYTVPEGNLFTGPEYADARANNKVKTEIYAMGFRNPFTLIVDEKTGDPFIADYGPDANEWDPQRGPPGITEFVRVDEPGFYGWPYFTGMNVPYRDYNFATGESGEPFDPQNPRNESPNNDGLTELPLAQPATIANPYSWDELLNNVSAYAEEYVPEEIPYPIEGTAPPEGGAPMIGEIYSYQDDFDSEIALPGSYDNKHIILDRRGWFKTVSYDDSGDVSLISSFPDLGIVPMSLHTGKKGGLYLLDFTGALYHITAQEASDVQPISSPFGYNAGGITIDGTATIDGLEFVAESLAVQVSNQGPSSPTGKPDLAIEGTRNDALYQSEQWGNNLSYEITIENGVYDVTIHLAEIAFEQPDTRVMSVSVEGEQVIETLDLAEQVGFATAYTKTVEGVVVTDGSLSITTSSPIENAKMSGFAIRKSDAEVPTEGLVGQWKFGEENVNGNTVVDASENSHNGTIKGGVTTGIDAPSIPGDAAEFNGQNGTVVVPDNGDALDPAAYTISTWVKTDGADFFAANVGKSESMWAGYGADGTNPRFDPDNSSDSGAFVADTGVADGKWHHVVYRHAPSENVSAIYIDGGLAGSLEGAPPSPASDTDLGIASKSNLKDYFNGTLADVRLYNRPLSESEILGLYQYEGDSSDSELPSVVGDSPPTDPDGDGLYEDVNGDGKVDGDDVTALFEHFEDDAVQNNPDAYDFNGNGRLDYDDIVELSNSL